MKRRLGLVVIAMALLLVLINLSDEKTKSNNEQPFVYEPKYEYGILVDSFHVIKGAVEQNQTLGEILYQNHIDHSQISQAVSKSKDIFNARYINPGNEYTVICKNDSVKKAVYFIYQQDPINYIVMDFRRSIEVYKGKNEVETRLNMAEGDINSSLWLSMEEKKLSPKIASELATIYAWTIDFFKIQTGDQFKVYYENNYINEEYIGIGKILAAEIKHKNQLFYAFYYKENQSFGDYYDEKGKTLRKAFLMAPVDYKRISSRYSKRRKHPVTGKWKGHFGTDYAAAKGTPIWTTANGTVIRTGYTKNNGNYVKIRHNNIYTTQYLHMSKVKPGIRKGSYVKQGDVIGYVGSTGLATGPHVCYRFWKHGRQVDPFKENLPPGDPVKKENEKEYFLVRDSLMRILTN
tara:strand:- start:189 stop:1403 length:1215 start_codon:yes stop_codon:yes gene_type:complete